MRRKSYEMHTRQISLNLICLDFAGVLCQIRQDASFEPDS